VVLGLFMNCFIDGLINVLLFELRVVVDGISF